MAGGRPAPCLEKDINIIERIQSQKPQPIMAVNKSANTGKEAVDGENPDDIYVEIQPGGPLAGSIVRKNDRNNNIMNSSLNNPAGSNGRLSEQSPRSQRSYNSRSRYPGPNFNSGTLPLPKRLDLYKSIIGDVIKGDLAGLKQKIATNGITEVVHIRGVNNLISDLPYEEDEIETTMWNPLHYAVYH